MAAIRKTDGDQSLYAKFDDLVSELSALRDQADEEIPGLAHEATSAAQREPPEPALPRATVRPLRAPRHDGSEPKPLPALSAPEAIVTPAPRPEPSFRQTPPAPSNRDRADPLPLFLRTVPEGEEAERRRRKPIPTAVIGICAAAAIAFLGGGAYTFVGRGGGDRLADAHVSVPVETAAATLTGSMLLEAAQRRAATTIEPNSPSAAGPPAASTSGEPVGWERAAIQRTDNGRPPDAVPPPASAAPAREQQVASLTPDDGTQTARVVTTTTISPRPVSALALADAPALSPASRPAPAAPVASVQPEPADAAPSARAETQMAALPPPSAPAASVAHRPGFPAEETGRLIARARSMIDTTADIAGARLLLQRATDMGDPAAAFALAESFDPNVLTRMRVFGIRADAALARRLYQQALDGGEENARPRLAALGN